MKRTIQSVAVLICTILLAPGCNFQAANNEGAANGKKSPQDKVWKVTKVVVGDLKLKPVLSMKVYGYETTQLNSKIDGYVQRLATHSSRVTSWPSFARRSWATR